MKKGFTLIELMAVIIVIGILILIAVPKILNIVDASKKSTFTTDVNEAINIVKIDYNDRYGSSLKNKQVTYTVVNNKITDGSNEVSKKVNFDGKITVNSDGKVRVNVQNSKFCATKNYNTDLSVYELDDNTTCTYGKQCTYTGQLTQGAEFVDGQYTYRYKQKYYDQGWVNGNFDGWGVRITNAISTDPVTTELCSSINGKSIVSMADMFYESYATSIDLSSFDTSNVIDMSRMFESTDATNLDLSSFDTLNVTNMTRMFCDTDVTTLDLSSFDTSKVTSMGDMFTYTSATTGYARTQADADRFNASSNKPSGLTFVAK